MYEDMFAYVKRIMDAVYTKEQVRSKVIVDRFGHLKRVHDWSKRLAGEYVKDMKKEVDMESLEIAAIFHDVAYGTTKYPKRHSAAGAEICRKYLLEKGFSEERIEAICYLIKNHSDKEEFLNKEDTPIELVLLMEADLMEGAGAIGIVADVWQEAMLDDVDYVHIYKHIMKFSFEQTKYNPMKTEAAKKYWGEKQKLIQCFMDQLRMDLGLEEEGF